MPWRRVQRQLRCRRRCGWDLRRCGRLHRALDACGVCNGPGEIYDCGCADIPGGDCDCDGNQLDALGVCGGSCAADADADGICDDVDDCVGTPDAMGVCNGNCGADADADGICDDVDDCVGTLDACGVCNGPGPSGDCGCDDIPAGDCDCDGNQLDAPRGVRWFLLRRCRRGRNL